MTDLVPTNSFGQGARRGVLVSRHTGRAADRERLVFVVWFGLCDNLVAAIEAVGRDAMPQVSLT